MLNSLLYRYRKQFIKKPVNMLLSLVAVVFVIFMILFPTLMQIDSEEAIMYDSEIVSGLFGILSFVCFFISISAVTKGKITGYSLADVNFHFAGPFSRKFNKIISVIGNIQISLVICFVFCCQSALIYSISGITSVDLVVMLVLIFMSTITGSLLSNIFAPVVADNESLKRAVSVVIYACVGVFILFGFVEVYKAAGSVSSILSLGLPTIIKLVGNSPISRFFPYSGWFSSVYVGIITHNYLLLIISIVLSVLGIAAVVYFLDRLDIEYYELASETALKVADLVAARKAGVDSDTARINNKVKVGKEIFNRGWGANAFMHKNFFEYKRQTKFFFVNPLSVFYRIFIFVYLMIMSKTNPDLVFMESLFMNFILNAVIYAGGKSVLEFNRPFFYMIPEKAGVKLWYCILADIPTMIFDSVICLISMLILTDRNMVSVLGWVFYMIMFVTFDLFCEFMAVIIIKKFSGLDKIGLTIVRNLIIYAVSGITVLIGYILMNAFRLSFAWLFVFCTIGFVVESLILSLIVPPLLNQME
ncbi:MAG: putative ABC exporter domain-containing protein [Clostridia bacterium]|nr:putative ABC exporter domain-containing protein [Clostridia bacterium]